ncbi:MAG: PEP-CTERM sorting domain-containing protein [Deltaproteobacteria bacterium]|nr:MAG: PEP-CTERM sorting domain-containing protein [Deltaproteobacteria bacterium]
MKKLVKPIALIGLIFGFSAGLYPGSAHAVPSLGVASNSAYIGEDGQTGLEDYQDYFVDTFIPGTSETHGFLIGSPGSDLIIFSDIIDADIFLLTTDDVESENNPELNGEPFDDFSDIFVGNKFGGYKPLTYWGVELGAIDASPQGDWYELVDFPSSHTFYALNVSLGYSGIIDQSKYFFAVADINANGLLEKNADPFSPKTTSSVGGGKPPTPEPATMLLVSTGLAGAALARLRRKT